MCGKGLAPQFLEPESLLVDAGSHALADVHPGSPHLQGQLLQEMMLAYALLLAVVLPVVDMNATGSGCKYEAL